MDLSTFGRRNLRANEAVRTYSNVIADHTLMLRRVAHLALFPHQVASNNIKDTAGVLLAREHIVEFTVWTTLYVHAIALGHISTGRHGGARRRRIWVTVLVFHARHGTSVVGGASTGGNIGTIFTKVIALVTLDFNLIPDVGDASRAHTPVLGRRERRALLQRYTLGRGRIPLLAFYTACFVFFARRKLVFDVAYDFHTLSNGHFA